MSHNIASSSTRFTRFCATNNVVISSQSQPPALTTIPTNSIPERSVRPIMEHELLKCCCGRPSCAFLEHNSAALGVLERDLNIAGQMGKALLSRHESYLVESEAERARLTSSISSLETVKISLQDANQDLVKQNRELLNKLEGLNSTLSDSDGHVKNLEALLVAAEVEVKRLNGLAGRAGEFEEQLRQLERDNLEARDEAATNKDDERNALGRWREAEMKVRDMSREVERIDSEARREREAHQDIVKRMERERELGVAAGRLKGIAALKEGDGNGTVVSHFVRDILYDNANLQAGIVELRELLQISNDEVQSLREQVVQHQPVSPSDEHVPGTVAALEDQMGWGTPKPSSASQEVHVHHHYHAKFAASTKRIQPRRPSRKRTSIGPLSTTPDSSAPSSPTTRLQRHFSSPHVPALSIEQPQARINRWSAQSAVTGSSNMSSMPSSPRSYFEQRNLGIFDRLEEDNESSRPTSPESAGYASPKQYGSGLGQRAGRPSDFSIASLPIPEDEGPTTFPRLHEDGEKIRDDNHKGRTTVRCDSIPNESLQETGHHETLQPDDSYLEELETHRNLRRTTSHDSLVSISGMDIHLAKRKPSEIFIHTRATAPPSLSANQPQPLASIAEVSATSSKRSFSSDQSQSSASMALLRQAGHVLPPSADQQGQSRGIGRLVGGWVRGSWGVAPMRSTQDLRSQAQVQTGRKGSDVSSNGLTSGEVEAAAAASPRSVGTGIGHTRKGSGSATNTPYGSMSRPMGINQSGPIPGFVVKRTPSEVHAKLLDAGGLREALGE